jgi:hypothetical protein
MTCSCAEAASKTLDFIVPALYMMDEVYHPETVEAILDFTYRITKAISRPSA